MVYKTEIVMIHDQTLHSCLKDNENKWKICMLQEQVIIFIKIE